MVTAPELKGRLKIHLNGSRKLVGTLRGYDIFLNVTLEDTVQIQGDDEVQLGSSVIRGNSIQSIEVL